MHGTTLTVYVRVAVLPILSCSGGIWQVDVSDLTGNSPRVDVVEVVKGVSPLEGMVTLSYRDGFTQDIAFDASEEEASSLVPVPASGRSPKGVHQA